jgi:hypothetical protein
MSGPGLVGRHSAAHGAHTHKGNPAHVIFSFLLARSWA